jgi:hypothetical protein
VKGSQLEVLGLGLSVQSAGFKALGLGLRVFGPKCVVVRVRCRGVGV